MKNILFTLTIVGLIAMSCSKSPNRFAIENHSIGLLTDSTQIKDLATIFDLDSVVNLSKGNKFTDRINDIDVFEKGGKLLLTLSPKSVSDSTSTIEAIKVYDKRFKTTEGINTESTFGDIKTKMKIKKIENTIRNIVVFLENSPVYLTIDKKELPAEFQFDMSKKIEAINIPDTAKIKYFMIGW
ncbi:hypothetical protein [Aurantibacter sp.]|uniref:hypothetical protein n=1 Tax=Aurantibacter sp. TaxID=2807103 RepID=UPI0035C81C44